MPQKQSETPSLSRYMRTVEKHNGERVVYTFGVDPGEAPKMANAIREYAKTSGYVYTEEEKQAMPDDAMQVYVLNNDSIAVASRVYIGSVGKRVKEEALEVAEYAYALLKDSRLLREE
ncbi:hypothetical protein M1567_02210 [Candidatus Marsarchaeota archaeon]|nr:hypothetical protein [Candidatus Marsarchaeota archaeon]